ncbi:DUF1329 domain-containing protein [Pseudomonas aeruginosa]
MRRAPNLAYDTPIAAADGLRTADDTDMFNGAPDRYDWKAVKKEIYMPYKYNYKVSSPEVKYEELLKPGHLDPQYTRYELHRVWVVEGTLKPGARHIYSKRTLYLDEDSWSAAVVDQYDGRGELWRVSMAYLKNFYDLPYTWSALDVFHDCRRVATTCRTWTTRSRVPSTSPRRYRTTPTSSPRPCAAAAPADRSARRRRPLPSGSEPARPIPPLQTAYTLNKR